jgi:hypothetical protein
MKGKWWKIGLGWVTILQFYAMLPIHISLFGAPLKRHSNHMCIKYGLLSMKKMEPIESMSLAPLGFLTLSTHKQGLL